MAPPEPPTSQADTLTIALAAFFLLLIVIVAALLFLPGLL